MNEDKYEIKLTPYNNLDEYLIRSTWGNVRPYFFRDRLQLIVIGPDCNKKYFIRNVVYPG